MLIWQLFGCHIPQDGYNNKMKPFPFTIGYIDKSMTFQTFVGGESNGMAKAAAMAVSEKPGGEYNPFYVYGGRGVGKTHLLNAIANELGQKGNDVQICRMAEISTNKLNPGNPPAAIIIDDFMLPNSGAETTILDLYAKGVQIVLSGSEPPEKLPDTPLSELIKKQGKSADIGRPEEELRIAILKARADDEKMSLPDDAARFIANHIGGNTTLLLGALKRVRAHSSLAGQEISKFSAVESLKDYIWKTKED